MAALVGVLWVFPSFWYRSQGEGSMRWLSDRTDIAGWKYRAIPVEESAEKLLVADRTVNGEFANPSGVAIHVFLSEALRGEGQRGGAVHSHSRPLLG